MPLSTIASPTTLTSQEGILTQPTTCNNASLLDLSRENGYGAYGGPKDDGRRTALSYWNTRSDGRYIYDQPSSELSRISQLSFLSFTGPLKAASPCPSNKACAYSMNTAMPAYRCENRSEFGGENPRGYNKSQLSPTGLLLYLSYSSFEEGDGGKPLSWSNMTLSNPEIGVFEKVPSFWVGWVTGPTLENPHLETAHIMECTMYDATYTYNLTYAEGQVIINQINTVFNGPVLPANSTKAPWDDDYQQFS